LSTGSGGETVTMPDFPILLLDPGNFTPYYDANLGWALARLGAQVEWITSAYLFEPVPVPEGVRVRYFFFTLLNHPRVAAWARSAPRLRRALKGLSYPWEMQRLTAELRSRPPGLIHVQWSLIPWLDGSLYRRWRRRGWRVVYTAHDVLPNAPPGWRGWLRGWEKALRRWLYRSADAVIVHSEANRQALLSLGVAPTRAHRVPMGDLGLFAVPPLPMEEARARLGLDPQQPVALFFGLIKPYKGLGFLLRSWPMALRRVPAARLLVAGEPMEPLAPYRRLIAALGLEGRVTLHPRYIPSDLAAAYFCAADVVVLPYLDSSLSAVLLTAYDYARPVVVTAVGGLPEAVEEGETGFVVPPGDAPALAEALAILLADRARAREMGQRARRLAEERHAWPAIARQTLALYEQIQC